MPRARRPSTGCGGRGSSLPDSCASAQVTPLCLPEPSRQPGCGRPGSESGQASQALWQAQYRQGRPWEGGGSEPLGGPSLCNPAWPWLLKCAVPGTEVGTHTHAHTRIHTRTHTQAYIRTLPSARHTGGVPGLQGRQGVAASPTDGREHPGHRASGEIGKAGGTTPGPSHNSSTNHP